MNVPLQHECTVGFLLLRLALGDLLLNLKAVYCAYVTFGSQPEHNIYFVIVSSQRTAQTSMARRGMVFVNINKLLLLYSEQLDPSLMDLS